MKKLLLTLITLSVLSLAACNTIEGVGYDLKSAGEAMSKSAQKVRNNE